MQELKNQVQALVDTYQEQLAAYGVTVTVSKRYIETDVTERNISSPDSGVQLLNDMDRWLDKKREKKYNNQPNRYHCIALEVCPSDKTLVAKGDRKEYAFIVRKIERAHIGLAPERVEYAQHKVLRKIEKRLQKILHRAQNDPLTACKDTWWDVLRYVMSHKYADKKRILGKERNFWEFLFGGIVVAAGVLGSLIVYWIVNG